MSRSGTRFPWLSFVTVGVLTLLTIGVQVDSSLQFLRLIEGFEEREIAAERTCGEIVHLGEVLSMSARMGAATGHGSWEKRFRERLPHLETALERARDLVQGPEELLGTQQVERASEGLVSMASTAFEWVREGKRLEAATLLSSPVYTEYERFNAAGTQRYLASMRERVSETLRTERRRARQAKTLVLGLLLLSGLMWFRVGSQIRAHVAYRRATEESLRQQASELERKNAEVREAVRAKGEFLARMSHEIRTPLNGVLGLAEVLSKTSLTEEQAHYVRTILGSGSLLESILSDILDFSKIEAGMMRIVPVPCSPRELVRDVVSTFSETARAKGIELRSHVDDNVPERLVMDPVRVRQVFLNLVGNAIKFTADGYVSLSMERLEQGQGILARVEDTGIGIHPERLSHVFEGFVQADDSVSHQYGGTGLGLTICRELTRSMGGNIRVESEPGVGTAFQVRLPAQPAEVPAALPAAPSPSASVQLTGRVLVAEDNPVNQLVAQRLLQGLGCEVTLVANGRLCVEAHARRPFDLILMDLSMPVLDGVAAAREIRSREAHGQRVPIVAFSASAMAEMDGRCRDAGMDGLLSKPIRRAELVETVAPFLGGEGSARAASQADFHSAG